MGVPATFIHTWTATTAQEKEGRIDWSPNTYAAVIDPNTLEFLPIGKEGELVISGPQVMKGYWNRQKPCLF